MKFSIKDSLSKCDTADLVTFTEEIIDGKLHFLYKEYSRMDQLKLFQGCFPQFFIGLFWVL